MEPWSKKHKVVFASGVRHSLSNSFAQPLSHAELVALTNERGDRALIDAFDSHTLGYTPNGGSVDLREEIAKLYGPAIGPENVLVFPGAQASGPADSGLCARKRLSFDYVHSGIPINRGDPPSCRRSMYANTSEGVKRMAN